MVEADQQGPPELAISNADYEGIPHGVTMQTQAPIIVYTRRSMAIIFSYPSFSPPVIIEISVAAASEFLRRRQLENDGNSGLEDARCFYAS